MATDAQQNLLSVDGGVWITVAELARRKGVSKQTAAEKVNRLEDEGRITTRRDGRRRLVELATYDRAIGAVGDAAKEIGAETKRDDSSSEVNSGLRDAQTERAKYDAQLKALDLAERQGQLVALRGEHGLETALVRVTEALLRDLGAPLNWVSEIIEASREGEPALRRLLRNKVREQRTSMAQTLAKLAGEAAEAEKAGLQVDFMFGEGA
ncbi:DNA-binding transcriptional ArsR family regulator [Rhizobium sp. BK181]|uniref:winged helix-turn-helix domain-containing protein n=1 Tax=Rhizobium sp. BK181 TaxID=2587072 RepID=UPI001610300A|nr:winged helix-turn-helix domain-containing protein [Rhizobium sp. BK181]MBB3315128.1 DNA-binding transcriptional ArsR family regulator [Rhizobium sp. BK181]